MIELIVGTYGFVCWLLFKKFRIIPVNTYTVVTAVMIGVVMLLLLAILVSMFHPVTKDGRLFAYTTPIVPDVKGVVIEVPVKPNQMVEAGELLFKIDPTPYQYEVDRLEAALADANSTVAQLEQRLQAATANSNQARAQLQAAESELGTQAGQAAAEARAVVQQSHAQVDFARAEFERYRQQEESGISSRQERDAAEERLKTLEAQLAQTVAAASRAEEQQGSGSDRIESARESLLQAQAQEEEVRVALSAESGGMNPMVRQILADLETKRWELSRTQVRAPARGMVVQLTLRPGQMAVPLPLAPAMTFVHSEDLTLVASLPQNVIALIEPGLEAEIAFKAYPGKIFPITVREVVPVTAEGQGSPVATLRSASILAGSPRIPVVFDYGPEVAELNLPAGAQGTVAIYTHHVHALSVVRKVLLRIKSWENYIFLSGPIGSH